MKKFYVCKNCQKLINDCICDGKEIEELKVNTVEASREKHIPVYSYNGKELEVSVGSILHPMSKEHYIGWVCVESKNGIQIKYLNIEKEPKVNFTFIDDEPISIYAYCNLHGLWMCEIK